MKHAILALPPSLRSRLQSALDAGALESASKIAIEAELGPGVDAEGILFDLRELEGMGITGRATAAWIETLSEAVSRWPKPDLVWSGEEIDGLHARDTRAVFEELLGKAEESLWISTYTYFDGREAFATLARRMDERPKLEVTLLINIQRKWGDETPAAQLVRAFADRLWKLGWPGDRRPRVFYDPRALDLEGEPAVLHAKAMVSDIERVLITSANFTESALDRNIELGLLVRDRALGLSVIRHFQALIERGLVAALPGA